VVFNSARRVAVGATVEHPDRPIRVYVHLDNRINPASRRRQLIPVLDAASAHPELPIIIAGDMNTSPFCWLGNVVPFPCGRQEDRLESLVRERGFQLPRRSGPTSPWLSLRLDAVYTSGLAVQKVGVDREVRAQRPPAALGGDRTVGPAAPVGPPRNTVAPGATLSLS
jgi:endonuclease/exonuclease/phosphatase family metal-dependent hydrolase